MKIWIDLTNSPHINFFKPFIENWKKANFEIVITARDLANTIALIEQNNWEYVEIGGHAGKNKLKKILYFPRRVLQLREFLKEQKPDIGISHSSFYSPLVCKLLGVPSVYLNDNEHAKGNYLAFKFATVNFLPEFLKEKAIALKWTQKYPVKFYPGIKEGVYLSQSSFQDFGDKNHKKKKETIFIRLEPWTAQYYSGDSKFMDPIVETLSNDYKVIILPRSKEQVKHFRQARFNKIVVSEKPLTLEDIFNECLLFIGAGGSMTRELAFLGVPTLSVYQGELLEVDKYLIQNNFMMYNPRPGIKDITAFLSDEKPKENQELRNKGKKAFTIINDNVKELKKK